MSQLITNYKNFDYKNEFIPNNFVFNVNTESIKNNVGINIYEPNNIIDIGKDTHFKGNITMNGNIYLKKNTSYLNDGFVKVLFYNKLSKTVDIGTLQYTSPYKSNIGFVKSSNSLTLEPLDNKTNTSIFHTYKYNSSTSSLEYNNIKKTLTFDLISNSKLFLNNISIYKNSDKTPYTSNINFNISTANSYTNIPLLNNSNGTYIINNSYTLNTNVFSKFNLNNIENDLNIEISANYDYNAGSYWYNTTNSNKYINRYVGIHKNNPDTDLYVHGNTYVSNNFSMISCNLNNHINENLIQSKMNINVDNIQSTNKLSINSQNVYIGGDSNINNLCIIGNSNIDYDGNLTTNDLFVNNNLNITRLKKSYNSIDFNNDNINIKSKYYTNNQIDSNDVSNVSPSISKTLVRVDNSYTYLNGKVIINNTFDNINNQDYSLYVNNYDVKVDDIDFNNITYNNINNNINTTNINADRVKVTGLADLGNNLDSKNIDLDKFNSNYINFTSTNSTQTHNTGTIYFKNDSFYLTYKETENKLYKKILNQTSTETSIQISKNNINTTSLSIDNPYINDLISKNISLNKIKLPKINNLNNFDYNSQIGTLLFKNNLFKLHDGSNESNLLFSKIDDCYKIEFKYNKIKTEEQLKTIFVDLNALYKISINQTDATITYITNVNNLSDHKTKLFYIRNNKVYTNKNENTFITLYNINKINQTTYTSKVKFDKQFDNNNLIYVHLIPYSFSDKIFTIKSTSNNTNYTTIQLTIATSNDLDKHKYKIKDFQIYNINNVPLSIYIYDVKDHTTHLTANLIYKTELLNVISTINNTINNQNQQKYGYYMNYLNNNAMFKIKNNKIYVADNIDTNLRLVNKRLLENNKYETLIGNDYKYS